MFNRQPYNNGKFNISAKGASQVTGLAQLKIGSTKTINGKVIYANVISNIKSGASLNPTKVVQDKGVVNMQLGRDATSSLEKYGYSSPAGMNMETFAIQSLGDEESIYLDGISLRPGQELVINTTDMTITIDGQNAMMYFDKYSKFFNLLGGINSIEYRDDVATRNIVFDVIWKDRWL